MVNSKRKEFAPKGSKFFPFRVDPFKKGGEPILTVLAPLKVNPFPLSYTHLYINDFGGIFLCEVRVALTTSIIHEVSGYASVLLSKKFLIMANK